MLSIVTWELEWRDALGHSRSMVPESDLDLFKQAARDNVKISEARVEEWWLPPIDTGDEEPIIALLLLLLPNLREINFNSIYKLSVCIEEALHSILHDGGSSSLRKLHSVMIAIS